MSQHTGDDAVDRITVAETTDEKAARLDAERAATNAEHLAAARAAAGAERNYPSPVDTYTGPRQSPTPGAILNGGAIEKAPQQWHPSPTLDEQHITALADDDESLLAFLEPAKHALSVATESLKAIDNAYQALRNDTSKTSQQRAMLLEPVASKKLDHMNKVFSKALENLSKAVEHVETELSAPFASATSPASMELREVLRGMKKDERDEAIEQAVQKCDMTIVTACLGAHPMASGVDRLRHSMWSRTWNERANPDLAARLTAAKKAITHLERAAPIALASVEKAMRANFADVSKHRKLAEAADAALRALAGE